MAILTLRFCSFPGISLIETHFKSPVNGGVFQCIRGRTGGAYRGFGSFGWSTGVRALAGLVVRYKRQMLIKGEVRNKLLVGRAGSQACTLDWSITKETAWLLDMFGLDARGGALAKRLFLRSNSCLKRPGPVSVGVNERVVPADAVTIELDEIALNDPQQLLAMEQELLCFPQRFPAAVEMPKCAAA